MPALRLLRFSPCASACMLQPTCFSQSTTVQNAFCEGASRAAPSRRTPLHARCAHTGKTVRVIARLPLPACPTKNKEPVKRKESNFCSPARPVTPCRSGRVQVQPIRQAPAQGGRRPRGPPSRRVMAAPSMISQAPLASLASRQAEPLPSLKAAQLAAQKSPGRLARLGLCAGRCALG